MKYIDTRTQDYLKQGIMKMLNLSENDITELFLSCYYEDGKRDPLGLIADFLSNHDVDETLEYIQMFQLSRRLNGTDMKENYNLKELLLGETPLSDFLKKYQVTFKQNKNHIDLYYRDEIQPLDDEYRYDDGNTCYLKSRLGYNKEQDYCVNGFAFRSYLEKNHYYSSLSRCPELIDNIDRLLGIYRMSTDYYDNSKYYCLEYLIPMADVIFDIKPLPETNKEKTFVFLQYALLRLYKEWIGSNFACDENLILMLPDDACIKSEWFAAAENLEQ